MLQASTSTSLFAASAQELSTSTQPGRKTHPQGSCAINEQALVKVRSLCLPRHPPIVFVNIAALVKVEESPVLQL